ncbi:MAG: helix-turn-helix domain-containing protein [Polyangia bacterium]
MTLRDAVEMDSRTGRLRPDLYFRLNGVALLIPPLRDRPREIETLAASFLSVACRDLEHVPPLAISTEALEVLREYAWPGNVRELRNAVERAAVMCTEATILPEHLPPCLLVAAQAARARQPAPGLRPLVESAASPVTLHAEMKALESRRILEAIERCGGNQSEAARQLGMPRRTLISRLAGLGVTRGHPPNGEG